MNPKPALLALLVALSPIALAQQGAEQPRTITATGESVVYVAPDEVIVTVGVETFSPNLDESKSANDAASKKLLAAVKKVGVEERYTQTDTLQLEIRYRSGRASEGIDGYISRRTYSVTLKDVKKLEPVIDAALHNGANQLLGVQYRSSELRNTATPPASWRSKPPRRRQPPSQGNWAQRSARPARSPKGAAATATADMAGTE